MRNGMVRDLKNRNIKALLAVFAVFFLLLAAQECSAQKRLCVVNTYTAEVGVREATGKNDGERVELYLASTNLGSGYAWCAAFVNWTHAQCGIPGPRSAAWSPSWFPVKKLTAIPQPGDVFGIYFPSKGRIAHVGFVDRWTDTRVYTVEGNTNAAGSREGDGVYRKVRLRSQIHSVANWIDL